MIYDVIKADADQQRTTANSSGQVSSLVDSPSVHLNFVLFHLIEKEKRYRT